MAKRRGTVSPERTEQVVDWFWLRGPSTYHELAADMAWNIDYARFAVTKLTEEGFLCKVGKVKAKTRARTLWDLN